jgi:hypothetical protein
MGFVMDFDPRNSILRVTISDGFTDQIMRDICTAISKFVASHPCRGIVDYSKVTMFEPSSEAVRTLASSKPAFPAGRTCIFVCPKDLIFGMARMYQMLGERTRPDLQLARTLDAVYHLLRAEAPEFGPVSL